MLRKLSIGGTKLVRGYREINQEPDKPELAAARDEKAELQTKDPNKAESDLNPRFAKNPKVSLIGHSLGSAIVFDILCGQNSKSGGLQKANNSQVPQLDFEVDNFFGVGSPVGMFQLLKGNHLEGHHNDSNGESRSSNGVFNSVTPQVNNYYNVFHPSDPVAYRVDPLAHCDAALLPPKLVPFAEGSFPSQIQALQQLSQRFASEASNMWNMAASMLPQTSKFSDLLKAAEGDASRPASQDKPDGAEGKRGEAKKKFTDLPAEVQAEARRRLRLLNPKAEQVDHSFQVGPLDITLVSALASHVSYFENADLANFLLQCIYADKAEKQ
ncbi:hypothetical protein D0Z03_000429 [Geotrichum reessii]|nr:hypothetical protein D0Z03_000429 [Galactomyces reessii]